MKSTQKYEPQSSHWVFHPSHSGGLSHYKSQDVHASYSEGFPRSQRLGQQSSQILDIHPSRSEEYPRQTSQVLPQNSRKLTMRMSFFLVVYIVCIPYLVNILTSLRIVHYLTHCA